MHGRWPSWPEWRKSWELHVQSPEPILMDGNVYLWMVTSPRVTVYLYEAFDSPLIVHCSRQSNRFAKDRCCGRRGRRLCSRSDETSVAAARLRHSWIRIRRRVPEVWSRGRHG